MVDHVLKLPADVPPGTSVRTGGQRCLVKPQTKEGDLQYPCATSIYEKFGILPSDAGSALPKYGCTLVIVPPGLVKQWVKEIKRFSSLYVISSAAEDPPINVAVIRQQYPMDWLDRVVIVTSTTMYEKQVLLPITTPASIIDKQRHAQYGEYSRGTLQRGQVWKNLPVNKLPPVKFQLSISRVFLDEAHLHRSETNGVLRFVRMISASVWFLSGTPYEKGPQDIH